MVFPGGSQHAEFDFDGPEPERIDAADSPDSMLDPDAIAGSYLHFLQQDRSSWAWELELRPWVENF